MKSYESTALSWSITLTLLGVVSAIFSFGGTASETASLVGRIAAFSFLALALVTFLMYILRRHRPTDTGGPKPVLSSHDFPEFPGV